MSATTEPVLRVRDLTVTFRVDGGRAPDVHAVRGVSYDLLPGEVLAVVGESGSGKSVSSLALLGLLPGTARVTGSARLGDQELVGLDRRALSEVRGRRIAMIFQDPGNALDPVFTIGYQLREMLRRHVPGLTRAQRTARAVELLRMVELPDPEERLRFYPHQLSGGQAQRVMIAMALACDPEILVADEPTTALDVTIQAQILDLLAKLQRETGMALVLITHDMGVVAETANRVSVQYAGQKVEEQPVRALFADPHHPYTAALLSALPERATTRRLPSIPGVVPGQYDRPAGCLFSPRCGFVTERCVEKAPVTQGQAAGYALCHYPLNQGKPVGHPGPAAILDRRVSA